MGERGVSTINWLILALVIIIAAVVAGVGIYAATRGGGGGGGSGGGQSITGATSLQFDVSSTAENLSGTYTLKAKNIESTSNLMMRIDGTISGQTMIMIVNGAQQKVWVYAGGTWTDLSSSYLYYWGLWSQSLKDFQTDLSGWTGGTWTSPNGEVTFTNIQVNPSLADSLFVH
jgi:hypothetical protein